ncbi:MAG: hypothetical protein OXH08_12510 [Gammaproteobacteria bacterium]|nr:hypothetical protein [Gammaproteobacteria bacterium]MXW08538.1 hypothetical protein [Gammaproteobacteria bacterium]MYC51490.1 hypothetical protein [Gammaproteobacteria bacterium]
MTDGSEKTINLKKAFDQNIVGENILEIAEFAVEKYEFRHDATLSDEVRKAALEEAAQALWKMVGELRLRRKQILKRMFDLADAAVEGAVEDG